MAITDEILMAYADGEMSDAEAAEVERAIAADAELAAKVALFRKGRMALAGALGAPAPVPAALMSRVQEMADAMRPDTPVGTSNVIDLSTRRKSVPFWQVPLAASVALAVGLSTALFLGAERGGQDGLLVARQSDPEVINALNAVGSGTSVDIRSGAQFTLIATFRDANGHLCREFEREQMSGASVVAVACRADAQWEVRFAVAVAAADDTAYAPASSLETLDAWLSATGAAAPMSQEEERAALDSLR
ncbi:hypothetical protein GEU84_016320 [Fertoebacter nigrum]|uniref:Putative zinc-finger domain-containing protein n=1 Tax=Fertoeibacter niger TaxID=2656921 RepID=A0A8X8KM39_9RHOB|nr:zf-HC2 domain-containing protein [Fertoeibacter niger]NUB45964.1 hypothetical protein [Fertoeibacter niger]